MTRTNAREIVMQLMYEQGFRNEPAKELIDTRLEPDYFATLESESDAYTERPSEKDRNYVESTLSGILEKQEELDGYIRKYAIDWDFDRISRVARAVMQVAMYESLYVEDVPVSAAINEAVELTRKYEDEDVVAFVNGILGSFAREVLPQ